MTTATLITINPISRLEGHGKVTVHLDDHGEVDEAFFHITQFRGYEYFCHGRPFEEMPIITQRICGICPVSHHLASVKACDAICGVQIPETAGMLRELLHMGQYIQSHALHFFHLASPDLLLGWDSDPAKRNVIGVIEAAPELARRGIRLRKFGQDIIAALGGKKVHPVFAVPGGVTHALSESARNQLLAGFEEAFQTAHTALAIIQGWIDQNMADVQVFANFPSHYAALVDAQGRLQLYDGFLRVKGHAGDILAQFESRQYLDFIGEHVEPWSYMKFPFFKDQGYPEGCYRVGPLARLNAADAMGTPQADAALKLYRKIAKTNLKGASLMYHYARMIELLYALEKAQALLSDKRICAKEVRTTAAPAHAEGVGIIEAPRGILIHHYGVDDFGTINKVNLIVATGHNNIAMNRAVTRVAKEYIRNGEIREGILNRIEGAIRCYDPCLSCATHALGQMQMILQVIDAAGQCIHQTAR
ncbi:MAG: Ni/Fe hydrogenase subunit alpha [Desulfobacteraceae bacterium]|nr:MAG: Ni/Fe hydrogenase subunit alpha [Desulfobacteraceae bacterium]